MPETDETQGTAAPTAEPTKATEPVRTEIRKIEPKTETRTKAKRTLKPKPKAKRTKVKAKVPKPPKMCVVKGCKSKAKTPRSKRCRTHALEIRKAQTKRRNAEWMERRRRGKAGHHFRYKGKPTAFAKGAPKVVKMLKAKGLKTAQHQQLKAAGVPVAKVAA